MSLQDNLAIAGLPNLAHAAGATVLATSESTGFPVANLLTQAVTQRWHSTGVGTENVYVDHGVATPQRVVVVVATNLRPGAEWRVRLGTTQSAGDVHDSGRMTITAPEPDPAPPWGRTLVHVLPQELPARWTRITLIDDAHPDGYLAVAVPIVSLIQQIDIQLEYRLAYKRVGPEASPIDVRGLELSVDWATEAQADQLDALKRRLGRHGRALFLPRPTQPASFPREALYATVGDLHLSRRPGLDEQDQPLFRGRLEVTEAHT